MDNACREYLFVTKFFMVRGTQLQDLFNQYWKNIDATSGLKFIVPQALCTSFGYTTRRHAEDLVLGVLMDVLMGVLMENSKEAEAFRELLNARSAEYVDEILAPHFGGFIVRLAT